MPALTNAKDALTMRESVSGTSAEPNVATSATAQLLTPDLCVIGAGSGGLSVAAAAAQLGVDVVLIEKTPHGRRLSQLWVCPVESLDCCR